MHIHIYIYISWTHRLSCWSMIHIYIYRYDPSTLSDRLFGGTTNRPTFAPDEIPACSWAGIAGSLVVGETACSCGKLLTTFCVKTCPLSNQQSFMSCFRGSCIQIHVSSSCFKHCRVSRQLHINNSCG